MPVQGGMDPTRGILIRTVHVDGQTIEPSRSVWIRNDQKNGLVQIEMNGRLHAIPREAVVRCPVPGPTIDVLRKLDGCFGKPEESFEVLHSSDKDWYSILRCKEHGRLFLKDTRGGIALYDRLIVVDVDQDRDDFAAIWRRYHSLSDDWLNHLGIAL